MKLTVPSPLRIAKMFLGAVLLVIGLLALITPLTPGAWLIFVGLELLGIRLIVWDKKKKTFRWYKDAQPADATASDISPPQSKT